MLSKAQEKKIKELHRKKGREKYGLCLVEGQKNITASGDAIEYTFSPADTNIFDELVTTETPQTIAAVARIPQTQLEDIIKHQKIIILDGVQDPGNVGSILRLALGFDTAIIMIESADPSNPKVIRSSAGAFFQVPWIQISKHEWTSLLAKLPHTLIRLEKTNSAIPMAELKKTDTKKICLIAGSEGNGISLSTPSAQSVYIEHNPNLESLNVTHALAIALYTLK